MDAIADGTGGVLEATRSDSADIVDAILKASAELRLVISLSIEDGKARRFDFRDVADILGLDAVEMFPPRLPVLHTR